jgi:uncharacterized phage protein gp47/JayE
MPDSFDGNGLQTATLTEIRDAIETKYIGIFGDEINTDQNTQDGQTINIMAQVGRDLREILEQINAGFDPDQAVGRVLDQRVSINGITRKAGTFTEVPVEITVDRSLSLIGLDTQSSEINPEVSGLYTVKDDAGTRFYLLDSYTFAGAGTETLTFRAAEIGDIEVNANTITTPETIIGGITGINNPTGATALGVDEETDASLRSRRTAATAILSIANINGLQAALSALDGVTVALVKENDTDTADADGTPGYTIWCIVQGGNDADIAEVIASKKTHGCGMRGDEEVTLQYLDGRSFIIKFDRPTSQNLWVRFSISLPGGTIDEDFIKQSIVDNVIWDVGGDAVGSKITCYLQGLNADYVITGMEVSDDNSVWEEVVSPATVQNIFVNSTARITIS